MNSNSVYRSYIIAGLLFLSFSLSVSGQVANPDIYLDTIKSDLKVKWPNNRTINLVFHGHSVPTGYTTGGVVDRMNSYPFQTLKNVNDHYPYSVVNVITTSIGGEQAVQGASRFEDEVLNHKPDVLFIDYALNDRGIGLEKAKAAWSEMIEVALEHGLKIILLTPTPDLKEDLSDSNSELAQHAEQIRDLAKKYKVGIIDSFKMFKNLSQNREIKAFMAQNNHINQKGHQLVADLILKEFFK